tara:strand:+ start:347 stop:628 length:282 start_codon:yes stop_codon:yes gene_type:complete
MLEVNTKVMIRSDLDHRQEHNGQIGIITKLYDTPSIPSKYFEVTLNKEHLGDKIVMAHKTELVEVNNFGMPVKPVDLNLFKKWVAEAKERSGA